MQANEEMISSQSTLIKKLFYEIEEKRKTAEELNRRVREAEQRVGDQATSLGDLVELREQVDELSNELVSTDIVRINCTTEIEVA